MSKSCTFDASLRIWCRSDQTSISYSDGDDAESYLLNTISNAQDVSSTSPELASAIRDWPSEYHLSPARHNLLRFLDIGAHRNVLELGCGCGGITRFFGEAGATVVAVEGSKRRAEIASARCRDLPNVSIYCDNLADFSTDEQYDFVTLIGVLEYAPLFVSGVDPVVAALTHARSFLKDGGALILAIENQLGLKYFNGCAEDHTGIPFFGIHGLYEGKGPITFGRQALMEKLKKAGFRQFDYFYPFPDYKLPSLILSTTAIAEARLNIADLLIQNSGVCHPDTLYRAFAEDQAWRAVAENRLLADLANSFLVVARQDGTAAPETEWLAKIYSGSKRRPCYQVETTIQRDGAALTVRKRRLFPKAAAPQSEWLKQVVANCPYHEGSLLIGKIRRAMAREVGIDELSTYFASWLKYLITHSTTGENGEAQLPGNFVDCIPANLIRSPNGELVYIDAEWVAEETIPLAWVVSRGVLNSLTGCLENSALAGLTYAQCIHRIAKRNGIIGLGQDALDKAAELEARLAENSFGATPGAPSWKDILSQPIFGYYRLSNNTQELRSELVSLRSELSRVKGTVSWRITAPLRVVWNLLKRLFGTA